MKSFFGRRRSPDNPIPPSDSAQTSVAVEDLVKRGNALEDAGDAAAALALYEQAVRTDAGAWRAHLNAGNALQILGRRSEATAAYRRSIDLHPEFAGGHLNLGNVLIADSASMAEAAQSYRTATELRPDWAEAWFGLGCALERLRDADGAADAYRKALELEPAHAKAAINLAGVLGSEGETRAARTLISDVLRRTPEFVPALLAEAEMDKQSGNSEAAVELYRRALAITPDDDATLDTYLFMLNFVPGIDAGTVLAEHRRYGQSIARRVRPLPRRTPVHTRERIRIGYVSPDFRRHSVSCFVEPLLRHHDRSAFEVHCYYSHTTRDEITRRFMGLSDHWQDIADLGDDEVAARIRSDGIDVLIDLAGHTTGNRLGVFARKPALAQITWLGYLCTTGLETMDFRLCDAQTDPPGLAERWQVETPLRLPDSQWCYQPQVAIPDPSPLPWLANGYWTFGSFNQSTKLNRPLLHSWSELLQGIPESRLRILGVTDEELASRIVETFAARGVVRERIDIVGRVPIEAYFACYRDVDIALDSTPYNGATTTCDALLMGVPVATVSGDRAIARGGLSLLSAVGLRDWVAESAEGLREVVQRQVRDPNRLAALRTELPARMRASPLMDGPRFTRNFEAALREAWRIKSM